MENIYWIQANDFIMCGHFCIGFIDFMLKGKSLLNYTNLFSPNKWKEWENNVKIFSVDSKKVKIIKIYCIVCNKYRKFKTSYIKKL